MTSPDTRDTARAALETLEQIRASLETLGTATAPPTPSAGVADQSAEVPVQRNWLEPSEVIAMRRALRASSDSELHAIFGQQSRQKGLGVPLDVWLNRGGSPLQNGYNQMLETGLDPQVAKALDTGTGAALIRQDLEPVLYELFIRRFPAWDRFTKEPANGLTHTFNQMTSYGDAQFMGELGTVTDDRSVYVRQTTNVAILATRRGISLKTQFATLQSGSGFNPEQLELNGGLLAIASRMQKQIFSGHATDSGGSASNELGLYDANAFTGLRSILNTSRAINVDPTGSTPEDLRAAIDSGAIAAMQQGKTGNLMAYMGPYTHQAINLQQDEKVRYISPTVNVGVGVTVGTINTVFGATPLFPIPGDAIGTYTTASDAGSFSGGESVSDIYLLDEETITMPFLGSEGPTVLDIPIGISGQLTHLFIIFGMWGLAVKAPTFSNKVRVEQAT
jgi:hypothetical protein